jgi:MtrB/PioB family decaheme-associated outer membrane protein
MKRQLILTLSALAAVCQALASPVNPLLGDKYSLFEQPSLVRGQRITLGVIGNDRDSFKLGEYTGLREDGVYGLGAFFSGGEWFESDINYRLEGRDLGLESRQILGRFGFARGIRLDVAYRELPHYELDSILIPFHRAGGNRWQLPADWVGASGVAGFTGLDGALGETDTHTKRKRVEAELLVPLNENWSLAADYSLEDKSGNQLTGVVFGVGGTQLGVRVPSEIDRQTREMGLSLAYQSGWGSFTGGYRYSDLDEESDPLIVQNPFISPAFADAANYPRGFARLAPAPDNSAHVFYGKGILRLGRTARLSLDLQRARHEQDDDFLPYTVNDGLATPLALPAPDLDGERVISHARFALTVRPTARTNLALKYRYHDRDDRTDRMPFAFVLHDVLEQGTDPAAGDIRVNRPYSRTTRQLSLEGGYRFSGGWRLSVGLERETVERDFLPVDETEEDAGHLKLNYRLGDRVSGWLKWRRADRSSGTYDSNAAYLAGHPQAFIDANGTDAFVNDPALRIFFLADRERDQQDWVLNWAASASTSLALKIQRSDDDYPDSQFGLSEAQRRNLTLDASYSPDKTFSLYGYASRAWQERDQGGFQWLGFLPQMVLPPLRDNSANGWRVASESRSDTLGAGLEWAVNNRLDLELEYALTRSETEYDIEAGSALTAAPLPDLTMDWRDITARARYRVREGISLALQYRFRDYSTDDFALDGVAVDTDPSVLLSGAASPDFRANTLVFSVTYELR